MHRVVVWQDGRVTLEQDPAPVLAKFRRAASWQAREGAVDEKIELVIELERATPTAREVAEAAAELHRRFGPQPFRLQEMQAERVIDLARRWHEGGRP